MGLRDEINQRPWLGWILAGVATLVAVYFVFFARPRGGVYTPDQMTQIVTIRFTDTGDTIDIPRGRLISDMILQGGPIDPTRGVVNPKTGQPTGFPFNKADWEAMIEQLNREIRAAKGPGTKADQKAPTPKAP
jgi:hypothetical protein